MRLKLQDCKAFRAGAIGQLRGLSGQEGGLAPAFSHSKAPSIDLKFPTAEPKLPTPHFNFPSTDSKLPTTHSNFPSTDPKLSTTRLKVWRNSPKVRESSTGLKDSLPEAWQTPPAAGKRTNTAEICDNSTYRLSLNSGGSQPLSSRACQYYADRVSRLGVRLLARSLIATRLEIQAISDEDARYQQGLASELST